MIRFVIGFLREVWWHLSGEHAALMLRIAEGRAGRAPVCDCLFHVDHRTTTACLCGEWTPENLYTGCSCIAGQPRCTVATSFTVVFAKRTGGGA